VRRCAAIGTRSVDALKIDRSFIAGLADNAEGETLLRSLVQLGKSLSIVTFAAGIEQQQGLSLLRDQDCDGGQGFLFARPLDVPETERFLAGLCVRVPDPGGDDVRADSSDAARRRDTG
jgi:EAL domain-containing protein (putative c-di-GMP-specific phosphodiesterase class I)